MSKYYKNTLVLTVICGGLIVALTFGPRNALGLFMDPIIFSYGWSREIFAFSIAIQNLIWGIGQPFFGALADKFGSFRVLAIGGLLYSAGLFLMSVSSTPTALYVSAGLIIGLGLSGASISVVIAAVSREAGEKNRSVAIGVITAAGSLGQFLIAPLGQAFITSHGWQTALILLAAIVLVVPLLALGLKSDTGLSAIEHSTTFSHKKAIQYAFTHGSYILLLAGFFVCGFHVAFITTHLPAYLTDSGLTASRAAWAIGMIGLFNIIGALSAGVLGSRYSNRKLLCTLYATRAFVLLLFLILPKNSLVVALFSISMGLLWLSTVPLTSGLVATMFGTNHMGSLYGFVFLSHQIGAFFGVLLGGKIYTSTGSYDIVWILAILLAVLSALLHLPIKEKLMPVFLSERKASSS